MKRIGSALAALVCFAGLAPAQKVVYQYDRGENFSKFKTYKWVNIQGGSTPDQITAQNIVNLINQDLSQKGLVMTSGNADLLVGYQTTLDQQRQLNWFNNGGPWMGSFGQATTEIVDVGTLVVDMYDPSHKQLIWRGSATKTLNPSGNPDKNYNNLQKAIKKLLKHFPPNSN
jgi:Domain of unknown function (DUF4136)